MIYKTLKKVSDVCQLLDKSKYPATQTINGVTFTNNGDGTIMANGTATDRAVLLLFSKKTFPIILTDNGTEFSAPLELEFNSEGISRTRIFYCNPTASYQKGMIEKNHEFIRYVIPKGTTMDNFSQSDITKMIKHINSL